MRICCAYLIVCPLLAGSVCAAPLLSLSSPDDLNHITVGDAVTINVQLSGLPAGAELDELSATVKFDSDRFGTPTGLSQGSAMPYLYYPFEFSSNLSGGSAQASFLGTLYYSLDRISHNGDFFSFIVTAASAGSGDFSLASVSGNQYDPIYGDRIDPNFTVGAPLAFTAVPAPEPAIGGVMVLIAVSSLTTRRRLPAGR